MNQIKKPKIHNSQRDNDQWLHDIKLPSPECNKALEDLRHYLLKGLKAAFSSKYQMQRHNLEDFTQEALMKIIAKLDTFRGDCKFTTWCMKITVNYTITELRKKKWKDVSLESLSNSDGLLDPDRIVNRWDNPEKWMMKKSAIEMINTLIAEELTKNQQQVIKALMIHGMPIQEVSERLGTNRNALYKMMHDARKHMKKILVSKGMTWDELLEIFS